MACQLNCLIFGSASGDFRTESLDVLFESQSKPMAEENLRSDFAKEIMSGALQCCTTAYSLQTAPTCSTALDRWPTNGGQNTLQMVVRSAGDFCGEFVRKGEEDLCAEGLHEGTPGLAGQGGAQ